MGAIFLFSIILGAVFGVFYDVIRILRLMRPNNKKAKSKPKNDNNGKQKNVRLSIVRAGTVLTFVGDALFLSFCGVVFSVFVFYTNDGVFRGFMAVGAIIGFSVYYFTVGRLVMLVSEKIITAVRRAVAFAVSMVAKIMNIILIKPAKIIWKKLILFMLLPILRQIRRSCRLLFGILKVKLIILHEKKYIKTLIKGQNIQKNYQMSY